MLADEHFGPSFVANLTKKRGVPYVGLIVVAIATMLLVPFSFTFLVVVDVFFMIMCTSLTVIACMVLKRRLPKEEFHFTIPGGTAVHTVFAVVILGIFSDFGGMLTVILVTGIVCLIVGIIVWLIGRRVE